MTPDEILLPTYRQMIGTLLGLLDRAEEQLGAEGATALLGARLAPDMYPLATQLRYAALQAQETRHRLAGTEVPDRIAALGPEGRALADAPGTLAEARACLVAARAAVDEVDAPMAPDGEGAPVTIALSDALVFDMDGAAYVRDWALPQFYFHVMTAYAIVRADGVAIGKADYVPHMFAYRRAGDA